MRAESFAEFSHDNLYKNGIFQHGKYTSYDHEIFCAYRFHGIITYHLFVPKSSQVFEIWVIEIK